MTTLKTFDQMLAEAKFTPDNVSPVVHLKSGYTEADWSKRSQAFEYSNFRDPDYVGHMDFESNAKFGRRRFFVDVFAAPEYGAGIYRYETENMRKMKLRHIIKIDLKKGVCYFATEESLEQDLNPPVFERAANKIKWFNVSFEDRLK